MSHAAFYILLVKLKSTLNLQIYVPLGRDCNTMAGPMAGQKVGEASLTVMDAGLPTEKIYERETAFKAALMLLSLLNAGMPPTEIYEKLMACRGWVKRPQQRWMLIYPLRRCVRSWQSY